MKIGQFTRMMGTTKETVRHYESMNLLIPEWESGVRIYTEMDCTDFEAIKEMKELGISLKDIQLIFTMKKQQGCGSYKLIQGVRERLYQSIESTTVEMNLLETRKVKLLELV